MIDVEEVILHRLVMPLQMRFETSFGVQTDRDLLIVETRTADGLVGWGESVALRRPIYNEETTNGVQAFLVDEAIPLVLSQSWETPQAFAHGVQPLRGNLMGKYALEASLWDIASQQHKQPLYRLLGGTKDRVDVGVSIGIKPIPELLREVREYLDQGYRRIKIKIKPGWDEEPVRAIRQEYPDVPLMVDANTAYTEETVAAVKKLDPYHLMMIEQPFAPEAWELASAVQAEIETPICLDESILTPGDVRRAARMGACRIVNVKLGRIGGITPALELSRVAAEAGIQLWCGGMMETGVGRAFNVAIATLETFTLPGDTAASNRYWKPDIIRPEVTVDGGQIHAPQSPGLGYKVDREALGRYQLAQTHFRKMTA
jgi:O-succinylbenzoate synthase